LFVLYCSSFSKIWNQFYENKNEWKNDFGILYMEKKERWSKMFNVKEDRVIMENPKEIENPYGNVKKVLDGLLKKEKMKAYEKLKGGRMIEKTGGNKCEKEYDDEEVIVSIEVEI
jgi:hypothetical protein